MLSCIEFQISASRFAAAILSTLRASPQCLPAPVDAVQLQRIRYRNAAVRNSKDDSFQIMMDVGPHGSGPGFDWIRGKTAQLAIDVTLDIVTARQIMASTNNAPPPSESLDATVVFNLVCLPAGGGKLQLKYAISEINVNVGYSTTGITLPQWVRDQILDFLSLEPLIIDLSDAIASGLSFANAGLAADASGQTLIIRAEVSAAGDPRQRWEYFFGGSAANHLGNHDWSVFLDQKDLTASISLAVDNYLKQALGNESYRLITVDAKFTPGQGWARITIIPYLDLPGIGTTDIPIDITLSVDAAAGTFVIDLDGRGIRDVIDDVESIAFIVLGLVMPVVGWFVYAVLHDVLGDIINSISVAGVTELTKGSISFGAPKGTTVVALPGEPFRYRATVPVATPAFIDGAWEELMVYQEGIALAGRWRVLDLSEGDLQVEVSQFAWSPAGIDCSSASNSALEYFDSHPESFAYLHSEIEMSMSGTAPAHICDIAALEIPGTSAGVKIACKSTKLPTKIEIGAPASYAVDGTNRPIVLEVRTTAGAFRASIEHPTPMTETEINVIRSNIRVQLSYCDTQVLGPWVTGNGTFNLDWIIDPLHDPDYGTMWVSITAFTVNGLQSDARVQLQSATGDVLVETAPNESGVVMLSAALTNDMHGSSLALVGGFGSDDYSVGIRQELLEHVGTIRTPGAVRTIIATPSFGSNNFVVAMDDRVLQYNANTLSRPFVERSWEIAGVRGTMPRGRGLMFYGTSGLYSLVHDDLTQITTDPVIDVARLTDGFAMLTYGRLVFTDRFGTVTDSIDVDTDASSRLFWRSGLKVQTRGKIGSVNVTDNRLQSDLLYADEPSAWPIGRSAFDASQYFRSKESGRVNVYVPESSEAATTYASLPWQANAVRMGGYVLRSDNSASIQVYRSCGMGEQVAMPVV